MKRHKQGLRSVALLLVFIFTLSELAHAAPEPLSARLLPLESLVANPTLFQAPTDYAVMKEVHRGSKNIFIIHIQDAHSNVSGQENLAHALDQIMSKYQVSVVLSEGGSGDCTLSGMKQITSPEVWKKVAKSYLLQGKISGEEYLNLISDHPMKIIGMENLELYLKSVDSYGALADKREETLGYLKEIRHSLEKLKKKLYPLEIQQYEKAKAVSGGQEGNGNHEVDVKKLLEIAASKEINLDQFPNLEKFKALQEKEDAINFDAANLEQAVLVEEIARRGGGQDLEEHLQKAEKLKGQKASLYAYFQETFNIAKAKGLQMSKYENLAQYLDYLKDFTEIDLDELLDEMIKAEDEVYKDYLVESDARTVRAMDRYLVLLETAYRIQMTAKEFSQFVANEPDFSTMPYLSFLNAKLSENGYFSDLIPYKDTLESGKEALEAFYKSVNERDIEFLKNTAKALEENKSQAAVMITGGYHTEHLKKLFKENGYSYAVLTPIVTDETSQKKYEKRLLGPVRKETKRVETTQGVFRNGQDGVRAALMWVDMTGKELEELPASLETRAEYLRLRLSQADDMKELLETVASWPGANTKEIAQLQEKLKDLKGKLQSQLDGKEAPVLTTASASPRSEPSYEHLDVFQAKFSRYYDLTDKRKWNQINAVDRRFIEERLLEIQQSEPEYSKRFLSIPALFYMRTKPTGVYDLVRLMHPYSVYAFKNMDQEIHVKEHHESVYYALFMMKLLKRTPKGLTVLNVDPHSDAWYRLKNNEPNRDELTGVLTIEGIEDASWVAAAVRDGLVDRVIGISPNKKNSLVYREGGRVKLQWIPKGHWVQLIGKSPLLLTVDLDTFSESKYTGRRGNRKDIHHRSAEIINRAVSKFGRFLKAQKIQPIQLWVAISPDYLASESDAKWVQEVTHLVTKSSREFSDSMVDAGARLARNEEPRGRFIDVAKNLKSSTDSVQIELPTHLSLMVPWWVPSRLSKIWLRTEKAFLRSFQSLGWLSKQKEERYVINRFKQNMKPPFWLFRWQVSYTQQGRKIIQEELKPESDNIEDIALVLRYALDARLRVQAIEKLIQSKDVIRLHLLAMLELAQEDMHPLVRQAATEALESVRNVKPSSKLLSVIGRFKSTLGSEEGGARLASEEVAGQDKEDFWVRNAQEKKKALQILRDNPESWVGFSDMMKLGLRNTFYGREAADYFLLDALRITQETLKEYGAVAYRLGDRDDIVVIVIPGKNDPTAAKEILNKIQEKIAENYESRLGFARLPISLEGMSQAQRTQLVDMGVLALEDLDVLAMDRSGKQFGKKRAHILFEKDVNQSVGEKLAQINAYLALPKGGAVEIELRPPYLPAGAVRFSTVESKSVDIEHRLESALKEAEKYQTVAKLRGDFVGVQTLTQFRSDRRSEEEKSILNDAEKSNIAVKIEAQAVRQKSLADYPLEKDYATFSLREFPFIFDLAIKDNSGVAKKYIIRGPPDTFYVLTSDGQGAWQIALIKPSYVVESHRTDLEADFNEIRRQSLREPEGEETASPKDLRRLGEIRRVYGFKVPNDHFSHFSGNQLIQVLSSSIYESFADQKISDISSRLVKMRGSINQVTRSSGFLVQLNATLAKSSDYDSATLDFEKVLESINALSGVRTPGSYKDGESDVIDRESDEMLGYPKGVPPSIVFRLYGENKSSEWQRLIDQANSTNNAHNRRYAEINLAKAHASLASQATAGARLAKFKSLDSWDRRTFAWTSVIGLGIPVGAMLIVFINSFHLFFEESRNLKETNGNKSPPAIIAPKIKSDNFDIQPIKTPAAPDASEILKNLIKTWSSQISESRKEEANKKEAVQKTFDERWKNINEAAANLLYRLGLIQDLTGFDRQSIKTVPYPGLLYVDLGDGKFAFINYDDNNVELAEVYNNPEDFLTNPEVGILSDADFDTKKRTLQHLEAMNSSVVYGLLPDLVNSMQDPNSDAELDKDKIYTVNAIIGRMIANTGTDSGEQINPEFISPIVEALGGSDFSNSDVTGITLSTLRNLINSSQDPQILDAINQTLEHIAETAINQDFVDQANDLRNKISSSGARLAESKPDISRRTFLASMAATGAVLLAPKAKAQNPSLAAHEFKFDPEQIKALTKFLVKNTRNGMPLSFAAPKGYWKSIGSKPNDIKDTMERLLAGEEGFASAGGVNIYDASVWQIVMALQNQTTLAEQQTRTMLSGQLGQLQNIRGGEGFVYNGKRLTNQNAWFFRMISNLYSMKDPLDGKSELDGFPSGNNLHHEDWKPIAGENAWVIIGALQAAYIKAQGKVALNSNEAKLALSLLPAIEAMQSPIGAIYYAPEGTAGANPHEVSTENNFSMYAALRILLQVLQQDQNKVKAAVEIEKTQKILSGIEGYFKDHAFDKEKGIFYRGGIVKDGMLDTKGFSEFAVDVQTWGIAVMGADWINLEIGKGSEEAAIKIWDKTKEKAGYLKDGVFRGVGFTDGHDILSSEWTFGAILMAKEMARYYESRGRDDLAGQLWKDADSMRQGVEELKVTLSDGSVSYKYANKRYFILFGWWANPIPSLVGSAWAVMMDRENPKEYFNPFVLGGSPLSSGARLSIDLRYAREVLPGLGMSLSGKYRQVSSLENSGDFEGIVKAFEGEGSHDPGISAYLEQFAALYDVIPEGERIYYQKYETMMPNFKQMRDRAEAYLKSFDDLGSLNLTDKSNPDSEKNLRKLATYLSSHYGDPVFDSLRVENQWNFEKYSIIFMKAKYASRDSKGGFEERGSILIFERVDGKRYLLTDKVNQAKLFEDKGLVALRTSPSSSLHVVGRKENLSPAILDLLAGGEIDKWYTGLRNTLREAAGRAHIVRPEIIEDLETKGDQFAATESNAGNEPEYVITVKSRQSYLGSESAVVKRVEAQLGFINLNIQEAIQQKTLAPNFYPIHEFVRREFQREGYAAAPHQLIYTNPKLGISLREKFFGEPDVEIARKRIQDIAALISLAKGDALFIASFVMPNYPYAYYELDMPGYQNLLEFENNSERERVDITKVYDQIRLALSKLNKYGFDHGHPHAENFIVNPENGKAMVIDWKELSRARVNFSEINRENIAEADNPKWIGADFSARDFSGLDLTDHDFTWANLSGINIEKAVLDNGFLVRVDMRQSRVGGMSVDRTLFYLTDLREAVGLDEVDWSKAALYDTIISEKDISMFKQEGGAEIRKVVSGSEVLWFATNSVGIERISQTAYRGVAKDRMFDKENEYGARLSQITFQGKLKLGAIPYKLSLSSNYNVTLTPENGGEPIKVEMKQINPRRHEAVIGRAPESLIRISDSQVSREHATLVVEGGTIFLYDKNSSNGTTFNGVEISPKGTFVQIGKMTLPVAPNISGLVRGDAIALYHLREDLKVGGSKATTAKLNLEALREVSEKKYESVQRYLRISEMTKRKDIKEGYLTRVDVQALAGYELSNLTQQIQRLKVSEIAVSVPAVTTESTVVPNLLQILLMSPDEAMDSNFFWASHYTSRLSGINDLVNHSNHRGAYILHSGGDVRDPKIHKTYLVPLKNDKVYLTTMLDAAVDEKLLSENQAANFKQKIRTYQEYINEKSGARLATTTGDGVKPVRRFDLNTTKYSAEVFQAGSMSFRIAYTADNTVFLIDPDGNPLTESVAGDGNINIGREGNLKLPTSDLEISRKHATLHRRPDGKIVLHNESGNQTYVNGKVVGNDGALVNLRAVTAPSFKTEPDEVTVPRDGQDYSVSESQPLSLKAGDFIFEISTKDDEVYIRRRKSDEFSFGEKLKLEPDQFYIVGRGQDADIRVTEDEGLSVSRSHFGLSVAPQLYNTGVFKIFARSLRDANPTFLVNAEEKLEQKIAEDVVTPEEILAWARERDWRAFYEFPLMNLENQRIVQDLLSEEGESRRCFEIGTFIVQKVGNMEGFPGANPELRGAELVRVWNLVNDKFKERKTRGKEIYSPISREARFGMMGLLWAEILGASFSEAMKAEFLEGGVVNSNNKATGFYILEDGTLLVPTNEDRDAFFPILSGLIKKGVSSEDAQAIVNRIRTYDEFLAVSGARLTDSKITREEFINQFNLGRVVGGQVFWLHRVGKEEALGPFIFKKLEIRDQKYPIIEYQKQGKGNPKVRTLLDGRFGFVELVESIGGHADLDVVETVRVRSPMNGRAINARIAPVQFDNPEQLGEINELFKLESGLAQKGSYSLVLEGNEARALVHTSVLTRKEYEDAMPRRPKTDKNFVRVVKVYIVNGSFFFAEMSELLKTHWSDRAGNEHLANITVFPSFYLNSEMTVDNQAKITIHRPLSTINRPSGARLADLIEQHEKQAAEQKKKAEYKVVFKGMARLLQILTNDMGIPKARGRILKYLDLRIAKQEKEKAAPFTFYGEKDKGKIYIFHSKPIDDAFSVASELGHAIHISYGLDPTGGQIHLGVTEVFDYLAQLILEKHLLEGNDAQYKPSSQLNHDAKNGELLMNYLKQENIAIDDLPKNIEDLNEFMRHFQAYLMQQMLQGNFRGDFVAIQKESLWGFNHYIGAHLLRKLLDAYDGDIEKVALLLGRAMEKKDQIRFDDPEEFVDSVIRADKAGLLSASSSLGQRAIRKISEKISGYRLFSNLFLFNPDIYFLNLYDIAIDVEAELFAEWNARYSDTMSHRKYFEPGARLSVQSVAPHAVKSPGLITGRADITPVGTQYTVKSSQDEARVLRLAPVDFGTAHSKMGELLGSISGDNSKGKYFLVLEDGVAQLLVYTEVMPRTVLEEEGRILNFPGDKVRLVKFISVNGRVPEHVLHLFFKYWHRTSAQPFIRASLVQRNFNVRLEADGTNLLNVLINPNTGARLAQLEAPPAGSRLSQEGKPLTGLAEKEIVVNGERLQVLPLTRELWLDRKEDFFRLMQLISADMVLNLQRDVIDRVNDKSRFDSELGLSQAVLDKNNKLMAMSLVLRSPENPETIYWSKLSIDPSYQGSSMAVQIFYDTAIEARSKGFKKIDWITTAKPDLSKPGAERKISFFNKIGARNMGTESPRAWAEVPNVEHYRYEFDLEGDWTLLNKAYRAVQDQTLLEDSAAKPYDDSLRGARLSLEDSRRTAGAQPVADEAITALDETAERFEAIFDVDMAGTFIDEQGIQTLSSQTIQLLARAFVANEKTFNLDIPMRLQNQEGDRIAAITVEAAENGEAVAHFIAHEEGVRREIGSIRLTQDLLEAAREENKKSQSPSREAVLEIVSPVLVAFGEDQRKDRESKRALAEALTNFSGSKTVVLSLVPTAQRIELFSSIAEHVRTDLNEEIRAAQNRAQSEDAKREFNLRVFVQWVNEKGEALTEFDGRALVSDEISGLQPGEFSRMYMGVASQALKDLAANQNAGMLNIQEAQVGKDTYNVIPYAASMRTAVAIAISEQFGEKMRQALTGLIRGSRADINITSKEFTLFKIVSKDAELSLYQKLSVQAIMPLNLNQILEYTKLALKAIGAAA